MGRLIEDSRRSIYHSDNTGEWDNHGVRTDNDKYRLR
jgi:hypothetical protein